MSDPLWYQDAVVYQTHVKAYADSDGDGIGDFRGLTDKLDYIQDLGVTAVWLLPFSPSPLRDDGYDTADYRGVHPDYGTAADFRRFLREAHKRGLRVITELVLNHTSDAHPWFQRARRAPAGSPERDFYVWSDTPERYQDARIIFSDFESSNWAWDPVAHAYYWHRFYSHQPDLNYDNPEVRRTMFTVVDHWLELGVDGLRLDAVPYLFEREGTDCENLPETHAYLAELRAHVDERFGDRMLLAEANQWPEDAIAYFGDGDECHMAFHFPLMPRMFMAVQQEDRFPVVDILQQTPPIPKNAQWAVFLRNHDELTLEMVSDEERDSMYRAYAMDRQARVNLGIRRRLAPLLGNDRRKIELMNGLLFSMPGTPVVYYGDEIGMGDNIYLGDRDGVRTPMQWSADRNAGFSRANPQRLYLPAIIDPEYHYEKVNVEAQQDAAHSLLWATKQLIALRKRHKVFGRGEVDFLHPENAHVLALVRHHDEERVLVVANLSRRPQYVELDLSAFKGVTPVELFGGATFPPIGELPYLLTLGPYAFHWMSLGPAEHRAHLSLRGPTSIPVAGRWDSVFEAGSRRRLEQALVPWLAERRWFGAKSREILDLRLHEVAPVPGGPSDPPAALLLGTVSYRTGEPETYVVPVAVARDEAVERVEAEHSNAVIAQMEGTDNRAVLFDGTSDHHVANALLEAVARRRRWRGEHGTVEGHTTSRFRELAPPGEPLEPSLYRVEQSNSSITYGQRLILKVFRRIHEGVNPDLEIGRFLTERVAFPHAPAVAGWLEHRSAGSERASGEPTTLAIVHEMVPNEGDAWAFTLDVLSRFYEDVLTHSRELPETAPVPEGKLLALASTEPSQDVGDLVGPFLESASLLGRRTAELHLALASDPTDPAFAPEPFSTHYQRSLVQTLRSSARKTFAALRRRLDALPSAAHSSAGALLDREEELLERCRRVTERRIVAERIRCHGDFHLGQVLHTGQDFVMIDFEGEPARPTSERRIKRSSLRDVAGMLRSFHYASVMAMRALAERGVVDEGSPAFASLAPWGDVWHRWVSATYLRAYLDAAAGAPFLPTDPEALDVLLEASLLEKAIYEVGYELDSRPEWVGVPVAGLLRLLDER